MVVLHHDTKWGTPIVIKYSGSVGFKGPDAVMETAANDCSGFFA
jgi:hypothetical protein